MKMQILQLIIGLWIGLIIGLSFIGAPLKFIAPGITTKLALGIGRLIFNTLNKIEIALSLIVLVLNLIVTIELNKTIYLLLGLIFTVLFLQSIYLLPILNDRVGQILMNQKPIKSPHHLFFVIAELFKVALLVGLYFKNCNATKIL